MNHKVLLGDEAVALGAIDAGISAAYGYPGTPSTEILEYLIEYSKQEGKPVASWCTNEKTAYEGALGVSYVGKRVLVTMKHVGLNVAADPFVNSALLGIHGGLVLAVADDPGMHSSQNEQDSRFYADFAKIMCLEPRNQQEAYEMTREAFDLSERFGIPVMIRLSTRISHSRAAVIPRKGVPEKPLDKVVDPKTWMLLPATARKNWAALLERFPRFVEHSVESDHNPLFINEQVSEYGVITAGLGGNYYEENEKFLKDRPSRLHIGMYPLPTEKIRKLAAEVDRIVVIEEGYPFIEENIKNILGPGNRITGRETNDVPRQGELNPDNVRKALGLEEKRFIQPDPALPGRPPQLCRGCPHADTFEALNEARAAYPDAIVTSDIGCYALGAVPPYSAIETIVCMGASVGMARGAAEMGYHPVFAVIGDSTFLHSGITPLLDAVISDAPMTVIIVDNETVAMTGGQPTILPSAQLEALLTGLGVAPEHIRVLVPLKKNFEENVKTLQEEMEYRGLSVVISRRECIETAKRRKKMGGAV